jgi:DNA-directed RNA polymerase beta subunit
MAKSMLPKSSAAKAPGGKSARAKRSSQADGAAGVAVAEPVSVGFGLDAGAFTVESYPDPGPKRPRHTFAKINDVLELPDLIELQKASFNWFVTDGLKEAFESISPIKDFTGNLVLEFGEHSLGDPKYSVEECRERDMTYSAPLRVRVRLITAESGEIKGIPDQEIFMGDFPLMTDKGTFMINGAERVIVSQLVRSPGVYYSKDVDTNNRPTYNATIIPNRGAWIEFETDNGTKNDETEGTLGVRIDKNRKIYVTTFVRALSRPDLGFDWENDEAILALFDNSPLIVNCLEKDKDVKTREDALKEIYKKLRPGEPENAENAEKLIESLFFDEKRYDLAGVGRYKLSGKLEREYAAAHLNIPSIEKRCLVREDMIAVIRRLIKVSAKTVNVDDIDHLGNRRIRSVGELLQNQFRVGLLRLERVVRERMTVQDIETVTPQALINIRPVVAAIKEFFGSSQLSQFMDQTNSLAELTHKRRLSALGPGGLSRERAGFEVRDVHHSHYGRICPIETPEGPNIGLIGSLATFARVNRYGFIETPYRIVTDGVVSRELRYLTADREDEFIIAQANTPLEESGKIAVDQVVARFAEEYVTEPPSRVQLMDVSPKQIVSVATALIPFLEHDDANRALMGANMQRQAVPLLRPQAPIIGTGMEYRAAKDSGGCVLASEAGEVIHVDARQIVIKSDENDLEKNYDLLKFTRSNAGTCINQTPIVAIGDKVVRGQILADGPSSDQGEMALGQNVLVAFMPWEGYNYEDAILISERMVKDDRFTSIHIEEYECEARDTKLGPEERDRADGRGAAAARDLRREVARSARHLAESAARRKGQDHRRQDVLARQRRRTVAWREPSRARLRRAEAQDSARRQDGGASRQQGRHRQGAAGRRHAVPRGRHAGRHRAQPAGRAVAHEPGSDHGDAPRLGGAHARHAHRNAGLRRCARGRHQRVAAGRGSARRRQDVAARRTLGRTFQPSDHRRLHLHAQARASRRRQDPRAFDRSVLDDHATAAGRQGPVRRPAFRRDGSVGARGVRRGVHAARTLDGQVRRRRRARQDVRSDRQGRERDGARCSGIVQGPHQGTPVARARRQGPHGEP